MELEKDARASWFRLAVSVVLDWRLVLSVVLLLIVLLMKQAQPRRGSNPFRAWLHRSQYKPSLPSGSFRFQHDLRPIPTENLLHPPPIPTEQIRGWGK
jgi:hypothetical protein